MADGEALAVIEPHLLADRQGLALINRHALFQCLETQRIDMALDLRMHRRYLAHDIPRQLDAAVDRLSKGDSLGRRGLEPLIECDVHLLDGTLHMQEEPLRTRCDMGNAQGDGHGIDDEADQQRHPVVEYRVIIDKCPHKHGEYGYQACQDEERAADGGARLEGDCQHDETTQQRPRNPFGEERAVFEMEKDGDKTTQQAEDASHHSGDDGTEQYLGDAIEPLTVTDGEVRQEECQQEAYGLTKGRQIIQA